jgi:hypothetical protein
MNTQEFFDFIMPDQGYRVLALATPKTDGSGTWFKYRKYETNAKAASAALFFDSRGETVYYGVNGFGDWYHDEEKDKRRIRTQENVEVCRSLFDDFDVCPEKNDKARKEGKPLPGYDTQDEALDALMVFFKAVRLTPTIVSSGGGFHSYITLDEDIGPEEWIELSLLKRDITNHLGIRSDSAVNKDVARILRPIGVHNYKYGKPIEVKLRRQGKVYSVEHIRQVFETYIRENNVTPAPTKSAGQTTGNWFGAAEQGDYPPSDPHKVAEHCAVIRNFRDTGGNIPEPEWWAGIGEGGEEVIHEWSSGYDGYSPDETQGKIDEWDSPPTLCSHMDEHAGCMADCPFAQKIKTPIQLGYSEDAPSVAEETTPEAPADSGEEAAAPQANKPKGQTIEGQHIPYWPDQGWRWNGSMLSRAYTDDEGVTHFRPFCKSFLYPIRRVRDSEGTWVIHWRAKEKNGDWREFVMPTAELASTDMMAKTLAANEVFLTRTRNARNDMAEFAEGLIETLQEWRIETKTYKKFGWTDDRKGFVIGDKMITATGEETILCADTIPHDIATDLGVSGSVDEWVRSIDTIYNRPGAEPFQFAICHAMGSVLVELMGSSNWHGLPLAFTGHGGTGKTTATKIACGFYGNPKHMNRQAGDQGSTLNAVIKRIAVTGSVPILLDEFSGRTAEELTRTAYALANGRDKERLNSGGGFATTGDEWFKNSFITSNDKLSEEISKLPAGYRVEATQLRFFEVSLPEGFSRKVFPDITQDMVEHHMDNLYGAACRPFIKFVIKNYDWVRRQLVAARAKLNPQSDDDNKERFYRDTIVTAWVAAKIAHKLGLIQFDTKAMKDWALQAVVDMRDSRKASNMDMGEHIAQYIASLQGRLIITKRYGDGRAKVAEMPLEPIRGDAVGRIATDDKVVLLTAASLAEYCKSNSLTQSAMKEEMARTGLLLGSKKTRIASGSTVPSAPATCYQLDYDMLYGAGHLQLVKTNNDTTKQEET